MRILRPNNSGRPWPARKPKAAGILTGILVACSALAATNASSSNSENASAAQPPASEASGAAPAAARSPGIAEILNMLDSKVDPGVIKAYIQNSSVAYNPSAAEIIALKQQGVPDELVAALLQRGGELRAQTPQAAQPASPAAAPLPYPATPAPYVPVQDYGYDYGAGTPYPAYAYGYGGYPYPYYYPYNYWWYNCGYPWYGYWPCYGHSGFYCGHWNHGFNHFHQGHFHNFAFNRNVAGNHGVGFSGHSFGFNRNVAGNHGVGFSGHSAPFRPAGTVARQSGGAMRQGGMVRASGGFGARTAGRR